MDMIALQRMLDAGRDSALLRFSLGKALLDAGDPGQAATHLQRCVAQDPAYSAGWKLLGKAWLAADDADAAALAWRQGIAVAQRNGDKQAEKEMAVFKRRLDKVPAARR
ncbi:tetratricopeptide repeat protein [Bacillus subtilis subsp. subtilis]|nr:tetratricopeptide repeat protein [Bacillus subtilis subsp. subtilis]